MAIPLDQFRQQLTASGLMSPEELEKFCDGLPAQHRADGEQLARELVRQKKLSVFQAQQIYAGKGKSLVLGNYVVIDKLGQGGMGMVLKARHRRMDRVVALKVMSPEAVKSSEAVKRFQREAQAAAKLNHPNIVTAFDADEAQGTHFLVMQFVEGSDLSVIVKRDGPLPVEQALRCILQAARGLEYAHEHGVIHRDIKPANLLIDPKGTVRILDMGLARIADDTSAQAELTSTGTVMGTVDYMAPEQALNTKTADARSDIYSLGISLWYLLTGRAAYDGDTLMAKLLAHRDAPIPSLCVVRTEVPAAVDAVFQKIVAKRAQDRYQTMTDVIRDLEACLHGQPTSITTLPPPVADTASDPFQLNFELHSATLARTQRRPAKASAMDATAEATRTASDTLAATTAGRFKANTFNRNLTGIAGAAGTILLLGAIGYLTLAPKGQPAAAKLSGTSTKRSSQGRLKSGAASKPVESSKSSPEKEGLDWLFAQGAKVGVGPFGAVANVNSTQEALASGKPVSYVTMGQRAIATEDLRHLTVFPAIASLSLRNCGINDEGIQILAELSQLANLDVTSSTITDRGLLPLLKLRSLWGLHLEDSQITAAGMAHLAEIPSLTQLQLGGLPVNNEALRQLGKLKELRELLIHNCTLIDTASAEILAQYPALDTLDVSSTALGIDALKHLAKSQTLKRLYITYCAATNDECATVLATFPRLESLAAHYTSFGDAAVRKLSASPGLKYLGLSSTQITDESVAIFPLMKSLISLEIAETKMTPEGVRRLAAAMPWCDLHTSHGNFAKTEER